MASPQKCLPPKDGQDSCQNLPCLLALARILLYIMMREFTNKMSLFEKNITKDGEVVGNPVRTVRRQGSTWASTLPVTLPPTAQRGEYHVALTVEAGGQQDHESTNLRVR